MADIGNVLVHLEGPYVSGQYILPMFAFANKRSLISDASCEVVGRRYPCFYTRATGIHVLPPGPPSDRCELQPDDHSVLPTR